MKFKRLYLRYSLNFQKIKIKLYNLEAKDFQKAYIILSRRLYRIIHLRNLVLFCLIFVILVLSMFLSSYRGIEAYYKKDKALSGGIYSEGSLGKFFRLNPLYSVTNQSDEDAVGLIFSGLTKHGKSGLETDLAEKWVTSDDRKTYTFTLKKKLKWQDGEDLTADDVLFTVGLIQNPDARSPLYESWKGVKADRTADGEVKFTLSDSSSSFIENTTLKILPKHVLGQIPAASAQTVDFNTNPVGSGEFTFKSLAKESDRETLILERNDKYYGKKPLIDKVILTTFTDEKELLDEYSKKNIQAIANPSLSVAERLAKGNGNIRYEYTLPRYVAAFLNVESPFLKEKSLRQAISLTVDRDEIIKNSLKGEGLKVYTASTYGPGEAKNEADFKKDPAKAGELLKTADFTTENNRLKKDGKEISLKIVTGDTEELQKTADIFAKNLNSLGIKTEVKSENMTVLQNDYMRPRNYDVLIVGEDGGAYPDLFSFWHSSQIQDPGLNFSKIKDRKLDKFLELSRYSRSEADQKEKLQRVADVIKEEVPAIYLYNPYYQFIASDRVKGIDSEKIVTPAERLNDITDWYLKYDRVTIDD